MTLAGFKFIFFWEWVHRLLGRLIGLVFLLPARLVRGRSGRSPTAMAGGWSPCSCSAALQGALGWFMVMSGLEGRTEVSPYPPVRASAAGAVPDGRADLDRARPAPLAATGATPGAPDRLGRRSRSRILFVQLMLGAWVAGFRAGYVSNTWPDMNGRFFPEGIDWSHGAGFALTHDPFLLHFLHRWWAWVVVAVLVVFARQVRRLEGAAPASIAIHSAFGTQILLGILTVLSGIAIWLAVLHQAIGALLARRDRVGRA